MGFDPRRWSSAAEPHRRQTVTSNVDALLAENDSLRREVRQLKKQIDLLRQRQWTPSQSRYQKRSQAESHEREPKSSSVSSDQVERWGEALSRQQGWSELRLKDLENLIDVFNRESFHSHLNLKDRLDRLMPGLGTDLVAAIPKPMTKKKYAVLASFALYGIRSREWLDEDPQRVVFELKNRQQSSRQRRRTRSDQRASDRSSQAYGNGNNPSEFSIREALDVLGLKRGSSQDAIKKSYRRLVKNHHPDIGGSADEFRRINEAYQFLLLHV